MKNPKSTEAFCNAIELVDNPHPRCPVMLLLDTSTSMQGDAIASLNRGLAQFFEEVNGDDLASLRIEACIAGFATQVRVCHKFEDPPICDGNPVPLLVAEGETALGAGLRHAREVTQARVKALRAQGLATFRPWIIVMTDGRPTDSWKEEAAQMRRMGEESRWNLLVIGVGQGADLNALREVATLANPPKRLEGLKFSEFFRWLSTSMKVVSHSSPIPGGAVKLPKTDDWSFNL